MKTNIYKNINMDKFNEIYTKLTKHEYDESLTQHFHIHKNDYCITFSLYGMENNNLLVYGFYDRTNDTLTIHIDDFIIDEIEHIINNENFTNDEYVQYYENKQIILKTMMKFMALINENEIMNMIHFINDDGGGQIRIK